MLPGSTLTVTKPRAGDAKPVKTYGPSAEPATLLAGEPFIVRLPATTPVTGSLKVTLTEGISAIKRKSRKGDWYTIIGGVRVILS